jgi:hypothetical protein
VTRTPTPPASGLARERTALAWNRSGLAAVVCIAVLMRHLWPLDSDAQYIAMGLVAAAAVVWATALLLFSTSGDRDVRLLRGGRVFGLMTLGTLALALVGLVLTFTTGP